MYLLLPVINIAKAICYPCIPPTAIHRMRLLLDTLSFVPQPLYGCPYIIVGAHNCVLLPGCACCQAPGITGKQSTPLHSTNPESFVWKHCALQGEYQGITQHQKLVLPLTANFVCSIVPTFHGSFFCCARGYTASHIADKHVRPWNSFEQGMNLEIIPEVDPKIN